MPGLVRKAGNVVIWVGMRELLNMTGATAPEISKIRRAVRLDNNEASAEAALDVLVILLPEGV